MTKIEDMTKKKVINDSEYTLILQQAVSEIQAARATVARQVNTTVNSVYWNIGKLLFDRNIESGYGSGVVKRLSVDLKELFPDMGLSPRNLWNMKRLYERYYQKDTKLLQAVAVLPWGHNLLLLDNGVATPFILNPQEVLLLCICDKKTRKPYEKIPCPATDRHCPILDGHHYRPRSPKTHLANPQRSMGTGGGVAE